MGKHIFLIPTKNEEKAIRFVLGRIRDNFPSHKIIVVDGHSTDNTVKIAKEFRGVEIIRQKSHGKGGGIIEALEALPADTCVVMLDGDGSYDPADANVLLKEARPGTFVNGCRFWGGLDFGSMPTMNLVGNKTINVMATVLLRRRIADILSGMKCFYVGDVLALRLKQAGFIIETELVLKSVKAGYKYVEVPIKYHCRIGESKMNRVNDGINIAKYLVWESLFPSC